MKIWSFTILLTLVSCGGLDTSNPSSKNPYRAECACMPETTFVINSSQKLPEKILVKIDDSVLIDECNPENRTIYSKDLEIIRNETSGIIIAKLSWRMINDIKLDVIDMGADCTNDAVVFSQENIPTNLRTIRDRPDLPRLYQAVLNI